MLNKKAQSVKSLIETVGSRGRVFTVEFVKQNGEKRKMNARLGVTKYLKGTGTRITANPNNIVVFDMQIQEYRTIPCDAVFKITSKAL